MKKTYPLLHAQTGILMACRKQPQCTRYNLPSAIPFSKKVEPGRLEEALRRVVECRPALRTRLVIDAEGRVRQYSDPGLRMDIVRRTMGEKQLTDYLNDGFVRPFRPFGQEPLCRFEVVETESHVWLLMDFHHIIADGFTLARNLMGRDLPAAYDGKTVDVEPRTLYDAAETEEQQEDSMAYCAARDYYGQLFRDVTFTSLPSPAAPAVDAATSASVWLARKGVDNWCRDHQVQPNWLFMAAFCIVMAKLSRQSQVAFATLSHGRFDRKLRDAYGMFVRTVPLAVDVVAAEETLGFIRRLRRPLMESVRHAAYPYTHFCKDLRQSASVTFAFQGGDILEEVALGGETVKGIQLPKEAADNELNCLVYSHRTDYEIRVDTGVEQLDADAVKMVAHAMEVCLDSIMSHPYANIGEVEIIDNQEKTALMTLAQGERGDYDKHLTFIDLFLLQAAQTPGALAVSDGREQLTYEQLAQASQRLACWLLGRGVKRGAFVAVESMPVCGFLVAAIAVMRTGAAYVPLEPAWPADYRNRILEELSPVVILQPDCWPPDTNGQDLPPVNEASPAAAAYMIYTSGTTGTAKGVMVPHRALTNLIHFLVRHWPIDRLSRISCHSSLAFDASIEDLFPVLTVGGTLFLMPDEVRHDVERIHRFIDTHRITGGCYTTALGMLIAQRPHPSLHYLCLGGERMDKAPHASCPVYNTYGPTECCVDVTYFEILPGQHHDPVPIGRPLDNMAAYVTDPYGCLLPMGAVGELCIAGPQTALGYWQAPRLTAERFVRSGFTDQMVFRTGDLVRWNREGLLEYVGRADRLVKVNGYRVSLEEVEHQIAMLPHVTAACVMPYRQGACVRLCAYFTADRAVSVNELSNGLRQRLPSYMIPSQWLPLDEMPLTASGKTDRSRLPVPHDRPRPSYTAPRNEVEQLLCAAFAQTLGLPEVGIDDDFFELGGTSLSVMTLVAQLQRRHCAVEYGLVFSYPTPRALAAHLLQPDAVASYIISADCSRQNRFLLSVPLTASLKRGSLKGNVLLLGATGFLGAHVLQAFLSEGGGVAYCLVRAATKEQAARRLCDRLQFYFGEETVAAWLDRIVAVQGDMTDSRFMSPFADCGIRTVINCAAEVRHFARPDVLRAVNTDALMPVIDFCCSHRARFLQVSTLGVAGLHGGGPEEVAVLTEQDFYIGQHFGEPYSLSKFEAERLVLEGMEEKGLDACVVRVGNLDRRSYDGRFQFNATDNGLLMVERLCRQLGVIPEGMADVRIDLSPVDVVATAIVRLAAAVKMPPVAHVGNPSVMTMGALLSRHEICVKTVDYATFRKMVEKMAEDEGNERSLLPAMAHLHLARVHNFNAFDCTHTAALLQCLGVEWSGVSGKPE